MIGYAICVALFYTNPAKLPEEALETMRPLLHQNIPHAMAHAAAVFLEYFGLPNPVTSKGATAVVMPIIWWFLLRTATKRYRNYSTTTPAQRRILVEHCLVSLVVTAGMVGTESKYLVPYSSGVYNIATALNQISATAEKHNIWWSLQSAIALVDVAGNVVEQWCCTWLIPFGGHAVYDAHIVAMQAMYYVVAARVFKTAKDAAQKQK